MVKAIDVKDIIDNGVFLNELHYTQINANFTQFPTAIIAKLYNLNYDIEGQKITAEFLDASDKNSDKVPESAVNLIRFKFDGNEIVVPEALFVKDAIDVSKMPKGSIDEHYDNRKKTVLVNESRKELEFLYRDTLNKLAENPLMQGELAVDAIKDIKPKMLQYSNDVKNHTNIDKVELSDILPEKLFTAFDQQQRASNNIKAFSAKHNGKVAEPKIEQQVG